MLIYPYKTGSKSVLSLSQETGFKRIKREGSRFKGSPDKTVINWGCSVMPEEVMKCNVINKPECVKLASNKLTFFQRIAEWNDYCQEEDVDSHVRTPEYTTSRRRAAGWLNLGDVVARTVLNGHSGEGIVLAKQLDELVEAPLYVRYIKKTSEFRVHVANGQVVDIQRKARSRDVPDEQVNWQVRNLAGGFIYARSDLDVPRGVRYQALCAIKACGLDFGAVDIIYNQRAGIPYVLEINTAPGLTGTTLTGYAQRFLEAAQEPE